MNKRVFLIVLDSLGIGEMPDSHLFGDDGSNTLKAVRNSSYFNCPNLINLGLFNIDGVDGGIENPIGSYAKMTEKSMGKDTTIGHWEIAGIVSTKPLPTYPNGFPSEIIAEFEEKTGRKNGKYFRNLKSFVYLFKTASHHWKRKTNTGYCL
jgi:phosphopentomutase